MNIAIDGPAGAGKSTVAQIVAARMNYVYIDTGAMYRALALAVMEENSPISDEETVSTTLKYSKIELVRGDEGQRVIWNGKDVTSFIRTPDVSNAASVVASYPSVREQMLVLQRGLGENGNVVMDGRDIGTHVLHDAEVKIFLTASIQERAERRLGELMSKGIEADLESLKTEIDERDKRDRERLVAPLSQAPDAVLVDTTGLSIEDVVDRILSVCNRMGEE